MDLPDRDSDDWLEVYPTPGMAGATARALLDAAEALGADPGRAVESIQDGFRVPKQIFDAADLPADPLPVNTIASTPLAALDLGAIPDPRPDGRQ